MNLVRHVLSGSRSTQGATVVSDYFDHGADKPHFAVRTVDPVLHDDGSVTREGFAVGFSDFLPIVRMDVGKKSQKVCWSADRQPKNPEHLIGPIDCLGFKIAFPTPDPSQTLSVDKAALARAYLFLH